MKYPRGDDDFPSLRLAYLIGHAAHVADEIGHQLSVPLLLAGPKILGDEHEVELDALGFVDRHELTEDAELVLAHLWMGVVVAPLVSRMVVVLSLTCKLRRHDAT